LLFEQGLELSLKRLKALAKYAFGMGLLQIALCTAAFTLFPFLGGVDLLVDLAGSEPALVDIRRFDESLVVGASLALSSSAFVLKLLQVRHSDRGHRPGSPPPPPPPPRALLASGPAARLLLALVFSSLRPTTLHPAALRCGCAARRRGS